MTSPYLCQQYLDILTRLGGLGGNVKPRETLDWDESTFDSVPVKLKTLGKFIPIRGHWGSVPNSGRYTPLTEPVPNASPEEIAQILPALTTSRSDSGNFTKQVLFGREEHTYFGVQTP